MGKSFKHTPVSGWACGESEKREKRFANRALRREARVRLMKDPDSVMPILNEVSQICTWPKDGRQWLGNRFPAAMRK